MSLDDKPLITISGNESLVSDQLSTQITRDLPQEGVEWQRSYGRSSKIVYLEAKFVAMADEHLMADTTNELQLLCRPLLHTYWTDCWELDVYKAQVRDDIHAWLQRLKERSITDWFIVVIDAIDGRKGLNKSKLLPTIKTSVLDKIRNDFPLVKANVERAVSLVDSQKNESKSSDSYQLFMSRLRSLLLHSYSKQLLRYEDHIRTVRESRNSSDWNFFDFFFLQEELAFAFEMLSLYDEALVQYDELDALFSQFVINSNVGQMPEWLSRLSQHCDIWHGLCLSTDVSKSLRRQFKSGDTNLIELRNYLFSRQSELLFLLNKPWELASRALPFLQNCVNELNILEITITPGGMACWVFLSALEILHKCERYSDSSQMESYSKHTVGLWSYARNKLSELGSLCGLMPGMTMSSDHLHRVVGLIAGMGADPRTGQTPMSPQERLKEALSGEEAFLKHYLEISELTMGTYKHIGRMRFARLIGKELAQLYIQMKRPQKAMPFLLDLEKVYLREKWPQLLSEIRLLLLRCYQMTSDSRREFKVQCQLSANSLLSAGQRLSHSTEAERLLKTIKETTNEYLSLRMEDMFELVDISLEMEDNYTVTNREIHLNMHLVNNFPKEVHCKRILVSLKVEPHLSTTSWSKHSANGCQHLIELSNDSEKSKPLEDILKVCPKPEIETFHSSVSVGVKCNNTNRVLLRRTDSHGYILHDKDPEVGDCSQAFTVNDVVLKPGVNDIRLTYSTKESGTYVLNQIVLNWSSSANIIGADVKRHVCFAVIAEEPSLKVLQLTTLDGLTNDILCGVEQSIILELNGGSSSFPEGLTLTIKGTRGLQLKLETDLSSGLKEEIKFSLTTALNPFQTFQIPLIIKSKLFALKESNSIEQELVMCWTVKSGSNAIPVNKWTSIRFHLMSPFMTSFRLHSCDRRKFIEILVNGISKREIVLSEPRLSLPDDHELREQLELKPSLPKGEAIIHCNQTIHYLWEILATNGNAFTNKVLFRLKYKLFDENSRHEWQVFDCDYKLNDYQTLYTIRECIEPQNGTEFCRAGSLCHLNVMITRVKTTDDHNSIMYEIVSDQSLWSMCGKTAGVVAIDGQSDEYVVTFEVMPLISGFLPFPTVRLSKYISRALEKTANSTSAEQSEAKLIAFDMGQVYNWSRATQVHVLPSSGLIVPDIQ